MIKEISKLDLENHLELEDSFFSGVTIIAGKRGMGKSWTAGVVVEIAHEKGIPFIFIDPQGANTELSSLEGVTTLSTGEVDPKTLAKTLAKENESVVILPSGSIEEMQEWVGKFITEYMGRPQKAIRTLFIDEAHIFAPNTRVRPPKSLQPLVLCATTKRSDGLGLVVITQRFSEMNQTILNQEDNIILHRFAGVRDTMVASERLKHEVDSDKKLKEVLRNMKQYKPGTVIIISDHIKSNKKIITKTPSNGGEK